MDNSLKSAKHWPRYLCLARVVYADTYTIRELSIECFRACALSPPGGFEPMCPRTSIDWPAPAPRAVLVAASGFVNVWPFGHRFGMSNEHQSPAYITPIALCYYPGDLSVCLALDGDSCLD